MPGPWRIFTLTGLSETVFTPAPDIFASNASGALFALYADVPDSITSSNGVVSSWGLASQGTAGARPLLITDSVTGKQAIRFDTGKTLSLAAGQADYLHNQASTVLLVARQRVTYAGATQTPLDSSTNGATAGFQLQATDSIGLGAYRILRPRVSNGSSWLVDHANNAPANTYQALKTFVAAIDTSSTKSAVEVDHAQSYSDTYSITLPSSSGGPLVLGNCQWDVFALEVFTPPLSDIERAAAVDRLASRFNVFPVVYVASDNFTRNLGFPSMARMNDGRLIGTYRNGVEHSGTDGVGRAIFSSNSGATWTGDITLIANDGSGEDVRESCVNVLANHDVIVTWFTTLSSPAGLDANYWKRSTDNGATWTTKTRVTFGYTEFEATSAPVIQKGSRILWPVYVKNTLAAFSSARVWYSDDNLATWTDTLLADGVADSRSYSEPGLLLVAHAAPGLSIGDVFALVRDDAGTMYETHSATGIGSWAALTATGVAAHSAGRIIQLADGRIFWLGRPNAQLVATLYERLGAGSWTEVPQAPALDAYTGVMTYGQMLELTPGEISIIYSTQQGNFPNDHAITTFRKWPAWQPDGKMPLLISPSGATITASTTQQYTALGAGNFTWSATGGTIGASSGLLTAGATNGTFAVTATDLNGYAQSVPYTITGGGGGTTPPTGIDATNLTAWWDPTQGLGTSGALVNTWTSADGSAKVGTRTGAPQVGTGLNGHASIDLNGTSDYFTVNGVTLADFVGAGDSTFAWTNKDAGSIADTGIYFENPGILQDSNGEWGFGTALGIAYAGQDGNVGDYDQVAQTTGTVNYYVAKYTAGHISISKNGGSFSAGVAVSTIPRFDGTLYIGKAGVLNAMFKGSIGDIVVWKALLSNPNITLIQQYLAAKYA